MGTPWDVLLVLALLFPFLMMAGLLLMEWVERPLRVDEVGLRLEQFFDTARPDDLEALVRDGFAPALDHYWRGRGPSRLSAAH